MARRGPIGLLMAELADASSRPRRSVDIAGSGFAAFAFDGAEGTRLWLVNLTAARITIATGNVDAKEARMLDAAALAGVGGFASIPVTPGTITLDAYAVIELRA